MQHNQKTYEDGPYYSHEYSFCCSDAVSGSGRCHLLLQMGRSARQVQKNLVSGSNRLTKAEFPQIIEPYLTQE